MDINRATIVGRLTRDPEVRTTPSGISVTSFGVATNFVWTDAAGARKESVEFHNVVAWRKLGEIVGQYLHKGSRILVEGRLQTRSWEGQDGSKKNRTEIVADNLIMLDGRSVQRTGEESMGDQSTEQTGPQTKQEPPSTQVASSGEEEISVEDIPF